MKKNSLIPLTSPECREKKRSGHTSKVALQNLEEKRRRDERHFLQSSMQKNRPR